MEETDAPQPTALGTTSPSHDADAASAPPSTNLPPHPLLESGTELYVFDNHRSTSVSPAPLDGADAPQDSGDVDEMRAASSSLAETHTTGLTSPGHPATCLPRNGAPATSETAGRGQSAVPTHPDAVDVQMLDSESEITVPQSSLANPQVAGTITAASPISASGLPQITVSKPFGVTKHQRQQAEPSSGTRNASTPSSDLAAPSSTPVDRQSPNPAVEDSDISTAILPDAAQHPHLDTLTANTLDPLDTPSVVTGPTTSALPTTVPQSTGSRRRGVTSVKASTKYKPGTISAQNFHMRDRIDENPDISFAECQALFKALSAEERQKYHERVVAANKQRKEDRADQATTQ